jgi:hypothetical protein
MRISPVRFAGVYLSKQKALAEADPEKRNPKTFLPVASFTHGWNTYYVNNDANGEHLDYFMTDVTSKEIKKLLSKQLHV